MTFLEIVRRIIEEHRKVRSDLATVGAAANDLEAVFGMQRAHANWAQGSVDAFPQSVEHLRQSVLAVEEGLKRHFGFEEQYLPPVFGESLMKALVLEHSEIHARLSSCRASVAVDATGMAQDRVLVLRTSVQQAVSQLLQTIEGHASREDTILHMLERALEAEQKAK